MNNRESTTIFAPAPRPARLTDGHPASRSAVQTDFLLALSLVGDTAVIMLALMAGFWIRFKSGLVPFFSSEETHPALGDYLTLFVVGTGFLLLAFAYLGLYEQAVLLRLRRVGDIILRGCVFWLFAYLGLSLGLHFDPQISRLYVLISFMVCILSLLVWRNLFHRVLHVESLARLLRQRVLFVGWTGEAQRVLSAMLNDSSRPYQPVGFVPPPGGSAECQPPESLPMLGTYEVLDGIVARREVDIVVLAERSMSPAATIKLTDLCEREYVRFKVIPSYFQILASSLHLENISGVPILGATDLPLNRAVNRSLKRCVDVLGGCVGLVLSSPIIAFFSFLVYLESPGPFFYRQRRTGRNGAEFDIIKIRSMKLDAETAGAQWALKDDPRRLRIGAFMRKWNIDETPQFWNVLKGEMSLVGPRPERPELIENFKQTIPHYNARHASKPGITGWAQVNGLRGNTSLEERVRYDLYYLENWTLWLDFQIMFLTFFRRDNAY